MAAGKHPAANKSNRSLSGRSIIMSVETVHTFLHQGITKPSRNFAALSYCPIDQQEVVRILSTPILISWHHYSRQVDFRQEYIENFFSMRTSIYRTDILPYISTSPDTVGRLGKIFSFWTWSD